MIKLKYVIIFLTAPIWLSLFLAGMLGSVVYIFFMAGFEGGRMILSAFHDSFQRN